MNAELKASWNSVWGLIDKLYNGKRLSKEELEWLVYFLNECEQGCADEAIQTYVLLCLAARKRRLEKARGLTLSKPGE